MKKIFSIIALSAGVFALSSCNDFLDQTAETEHSAEEVWNSTFYTEGRVNKLYGAMTQDRTYSQDLAFTWNMNSDIELVDGLGSSAYDTGRERGNMNYNYSTGWSNLNDVWTALYGIVEEANQNIEGIRNSSLLANGTNNEIKTMQRYLGESLTIRALIYLDLVRFWGDVPLSLEATKSDLSNAYLGKTDRDEILDQMMADLEEAIEYLPWADEVAGYTTERVTKGYAHALLAQIALTRGGYAIREASKADQGYVTAERNSDPVYPTQRPSNDERKALYEKALEHLSAIITSGKHDLNPSFENEWDLVNKLKLDKTYHENLFEVPMGLNVTGELGYTVGVRLNGITSKYGYGNSSGKMKVTAPFFYSFKENDTRRDITCANFQIKKDETRENVTIEEMLGNTPFGIYVGKWDPRKMSNEWLQENLKATAKHMTGINPILMRYSQVLIYYAEVMNELVGPDANYPGDAGLTARQALAMVHMRAFADEDKAAAEAYINRLPGNKEGFFEGIVQEHAWELAGEGCRKFDLIRWNLLVDKIMEFKQNYLDDLDNGVYQKTIYFNYLDKNKTEIDMSSITWNGFPAGKGADDYEGNASSFGGSDITKTTDTQIYTNLPSISSGLVGKCTISGTTITYDAPVSGVINRYIMPIGSSTISASNGKLHNSYGFGD